MNEQYGRRVFIYTRDEEPQSGRGATNKNTRGFALADDGTMLASVLLENAANCERWLTSGDRLANYHDYFGNRPILFLWSTAQDWPIGMQDTFAHAWKLLWERSHAG